MKVNCCFIVGIIAIIILSFQSNPVSAQDEITWMVTHWPPLMDMSSENPNAKIIEGQFGIQLKLLQKKITAYKHVNENMKWNRLWGLIKQGKHTLTCVAYKNKAREKFAYFSIPISIILPNQIVMRKKEADILGNPKSISLSELMQDKRFKGMLIKARSYSHDLDSILLKNEKESNISRMIVNEESYLRMLLLKRMDYIVEYPFVINYNMNKYFYGCSTKVVAMPIKEVAPFYYVYVAGPKNDWGKKVIGEVNKALKELRKVKEFREAATHMYSQDQQKTFLKFYSESILSVN